MGKWTKVRITLLALIFVFLYVPMMFLMFLSFASEMKTRAIITYSWPPVFSFEVIRWVFEDPATMLAFRESFTIGIGSGLVSMVFATLTGWGLTQFKFKHKVVYLAAYILPIIIPNLIKGLSGLLFLCEIGFPRSVPTAILFNAVYGTSFGILVMIAQLNMFRKDLLRAASDLGAAPFAQLKEIAFPLIWPGVVTAFVIAFILGFTEWDLTSYTGGITPTIPSIAWSQLRHGFRPGLFGVSAITVLIAITAAIVIYLLVRRTYRKTRALRLIPT